MIRYRDGGFIPEHVDGAQYAKWHRRINAVVTAAHADGELWIDGERIKLGFFPDREVHAVNSVVGERVLFSVGARIEPMLSSSLTLLEAPRSLDALSC